MSSEKSLTPQIRFKGFTEAWEQRKAIDLFKDVSEKGFDNLPVLSATQDRGMVYRDENGINISHDKKNELTYKHVIPGQFVIHLRSFQGGFAHSAIEGITSPAYTVFKFSNASQHDDIFWKYIFMSERFIKSLETVTYGIRDGRSISYSEFLGLPFAVPEKEEESCIGYFLKKYDSLITLHQRKLDALKKIKSALLEKMFPKDGSDIPEIRFAGFTEAWEQRKLGELATFNPNADLPAQFEYVDLESVAGTEMLSHRTEIRDSAPSRAQRLAQFGDLFYQTVRPYQKNNYLYEKPDNNYVFSTGYAQMRPLVDGYFLLSLVQNEGFIKKVLDNCSGTSYPAINANVLSSIVVNSSSHRKEQIQVGYLFRRIDNLITLHQRKLDALKKIKSALLEKMFV